LTQFFQLGKRSFLCATINHCFDQRPHLRIRRFLLWAEIPGELVEDLFLRQNLGANLADEFLRVRLNGFGRVAGEVNLRSICNCLCIDTDQEKDRLIPARFDES
jgi:hypothetical protein